MKLFSLINFKIKLESRLMNWQMEMYKIITNNNMYKIMKIIPFNLQNIHKKVNTRKIHIYLAINKKIIQVQQILVITYYNKLKNNKVVYKPINKIKSNKLYSLFNKFKPNNKPDNNKTYKYNNNLLMKITQHNKLLNKNKIKKLHKLTHQNNQKIKNKNLITKNLQKLQKIIKIKDH